MSDKILAWHFLPDDGKLQYKPRHKVVVGKTLKVDPEKLALCKYGLHASAMPIDAIKYAPGALVCRVELGGRIIEKDDKIVASERTVLWMADATSVLRLFGCWCVRNTPIGDGRRHWDLVTDPRSRRAVVVAERYARGKATKAELDAAWAAASDAAGDVARDAAWAAASDAAGVVARNAAWAAAWAAASDAASDAALDAASDAARDAAWAAASDAALAAAWDAQNAQLEKMLLKLMRGGE